jgi:hypothetical protein
MNQKHYNNEYYIVQNTGFTSGTSWFDEGRFKNLGEAEQKLKENKNRLPSAQHRIIFRTIKITESVYE